MAGASPRSSLHISENMTQLLPTTNSNSLSLKFKQKTQKPSERHYALMFPMKYPKAKNNSEVIVLLCTSLLLSFIAACFTQD